MGASHPSQYEIRIQGHLEPHRLDSYQPLTIAHLADGGTVLVASVRDQAALYGLLNHIYRLGVTLLSVNWVSGPDGRQGTPDMSDKRRRIDDTAGEG